MVLRPEPSALISAFDGERLDFVSGLLKRDSLRVSAISPPPYARCSGRGIGFDDSGVSPALYQLGAKTILLLSGPHEGIMWPACSFGVTLINIVEGDRRSMNQIEAPPPSFIRSTVSPSNLQEWSRKPT